MAGFRTFATGEVLTAANVNNFLMGQSVMRFADATARTAALGTDVVEGMLTYNLATDQLEVFDGTNFVVAAPEPPAGIGSNVVQTVKTDTFSTSSASFVAVTGLTATITPSTSTSKILVVCYAPVSNTTNSSGAGVYLQLVRGATPIALGDAAGVRRRVTYGATGNINVENVFAVTLTFLDAPASTSAVTYGVEIARGAGSAVVNRSGLDIDNTNNSRMVATMTVIEVAA